MAQLRDTVVSGSLRATDSLLTTTLQTKILNAPTESNGTTFGPGTNKRVLISNGTSVYWGTTTAITQVGTITSGTWQGTTIGTAYGGTGNTSFTQWGIIYANPATKLVSTAAGTSGYLLQGNGSAAPSWIQATDANTASTIVKRDASGNFSAGTITASLSGNAATATRINGNLGALTDTSSHNIWVSSTASADGIPKYVSGCYITASTGTLVCNSVKNAVWNDYAECRQAYTEEPGRCVTETSTKKMALTTTRLQPGCKLISDTYGTLMGETEQAKTPIAIAGRVLAYPYRDKTEYKLGAAVCSAPNGTVDIMTREEIMTYPERIVGTVSEIPDYEVWHGGSKDSPIEIKVNGRIWIYVK